jgi:DNA-binding MarR family transcriptional regulator
VVSELRWLIGAFPVAKYNVEDRGAAMTTESQSKEPRTAISEQEPLEQTVYSLLIRTAARLEAELNRVFRPLDLTGATYSILKVLESAGVSGRSCGDISEQLIAEVPDMTRLLDRLERLGYVMRERSNIDRRMVKVTITDKGRAVLDGLREPVQACHKRQLGTVGEAKLRELEQLLTSVLGRLRDEKVASDVTEDSLVKQAPHSGL